MLSRLINVLIPMTLIVMMLRIGLEITTAEIIDTVTTLRLVALDLLANYICVPPSLSRCC